MDDDLVRSGRYARLEIPGRTSGEIRTVTVGFSEEPDGSLLIAAGAADADWARNLEATTDAIRVTIGDRRVHATADVLDEDDPRRGAAIRALILRYGTPAERLGGSVFILRPVPGR
jgi:deazaflavin-dependent oxidoreductase (nitroreductase family)